jgi:hypothetical protein
MGGFFGAKLKIFFFYTFLRTSPLKINILKITKLHPIELNEIYEINR